MTKEELRNIFQKNAERSGEVPPELREVINAINGMAYKLCGTMLVNCGDSPELTTAIRRVYEGAVSFQNALMQVATREVKGQ